MTVLQKVSTLILLFAKVREDSRQRDKHYGSQWGMQSSNHFNSDSSGRES